MIEDPDTSGLSELELQTLATQYACDEVERLSKDKTCSTCHWWGRYNKSQPLGHCVWHTGAKNTSAQTLHFKGILKTSPEFGCNQHKQDERKQKD